MIVNLVFGLFAFCLCALWVGAFWRCLCKPEMQADPAKIHRLEFELGFRDDPPLKPKVHHGPRTPINPSSAMWKDLYTDEPGAIIYYDPAKGTPTYK